MKKLMICLAMIGNIFCSCAETNSKSASPVENPHSIVVFYSATGTTKDVAEKIASATGSRLVEIVPDQQYTAADLNWRDSQSRSSVEMNDKMSRPAIKNGQIDLKDIDTVFIGYPIWWDQAPRVVNSFIEDNNLTNKTIVTFCTSGGSSIDGSTQSLRETYPKLNIIQGKCLNGMSQEEIGSWVKSL